MSDFIINYKKKLHKINGMSTTKEFPNLSEMQLSAITIQLWIVINRKSVITINIWFTLARFGICFSALGTFENDQFQ